MKGSEQINELAAALSKAQGEFQAAKMENTNPFFKSKYADLGSVIEASKDPCAKNGLAVAQPVACDGEKITVNTILMHASGQWISSEFTMTIGETRGSSPAQAAGSLITYMRRYSLAAVLGLYADEDTDGNDEKSTAGNKSNGNNGNGNGNKAPTTDKPKAAAPAETKTAQPAPTNGKVERPYPGDILKTGLNAKAEKVTDKAQPHHKQSVAAALNCYLKDENDKSGETHRHMLMYYLFGVNSMDELSDGQILALHGWLKPEYDKVAKAFIITDPHAKAEIELAGERMTEEMNGVTENG
jgi:hypothetical protein